jgi:hypothetical protein
MRQVDSDRTRVFSQRQLPTDQDYAGGQSCSIREYQSDQPSSKAASTFARNAPPKEEEIRRKKQDGLDRSLHIRRLFPHREPITLYYGNGREGLVEKSPFKAIIVAASIPHVREVWHLAEQLSTANGRMVVPVGDRNKQSLLIIQRRGERFDLFTLEGISFNFLRMVRAHGDVDAVQIKCGEIASHRRERYS